MDLLKNTNKKTKVFLIFNLLFGLFYFSLQIWFISQSINRIPFIFVFFNLLFLFAYFVLSFFFFKKLEVIALKNEKLNNTEKHNKILNDIIDKLRCFKHDYNNTITIIDGYINNNDLKGLKEYFSKLEKDCRSVNDLEILAPNVINNPGIYNLITSKYNKAVEHGIDFSISFFLDLNEINLEIYDFSKILGILLDNAIESSSESIEKNVNVVFRREHNKHRDIILIENSYKNKNVNIEGIYEKGYSEKENHTGLGLWEIRKFLKKHSNLNLHTSKTEDLFSQQLEIYF